MNTKSSSRFGLTLGTTSETRRRNGRFRNRHPTDGNAPTLEAAKAAFQASWRQWLPWAKLGEGRGKHRFADSGSPLTSVRECRNTE